MAAIGPDFKRRFVNQAPVSNADVQPTLAHLMKMKDAEPREAARPGHRRSAGWWPADDPLDPRGQAIAPVREWLSTVLMYQVADDRHLSG